MQQGLACFAPLPAYCPRLKKHLMTRRINENMRGGREVRGQQRVEGRTALQTQVGNEQAKAQSVQGISLNNCTEYAMEQHRLSVNSTMVTVFNNLRS